VIVRTGHPTFDGVLESANQLLRRLLFLPEQASTIARDVDSLHYFELGVMALIAVATGTLGLWFVWRFRRRGPDERTPRIVAPLWAELGGASALLALFVFWWVLSFREFGYEKAAPPGSETVYVTGKQWMWKFAYAGGRSSAGVLFVPAGRSVKLLLTSRDVIHSFYVPDFRVKQDAVPGRYTSLWFEASRPGAHRIFCAELCGTGHSRMWGKVIALAPADFDRWLAGWEPTAEEIGGLGIDLGDALPDGREPPAGAADLATQGLRIAAGKGCLSCHSVDGTSRTGPSWRGLYGSTVALADGGTVRADEAYLTESMMDPEAKVVAGYPPVMPSFQGQLEAGETAAVVEYIKSLSNPAP
jgi:cytochrome c oxidase subunit 2